MIEVWEFLMRPRKTSIAYPDRKGQVITQRGRGRYWVVSRGCKQSMGLDIDVPVDMKSY